MIFRILADLVAIFHFAFVVFVLFGGLLTLRWSWMPWLHLPALGWGAIVALCGWYCPLTPLENALRRAGGSEPFAGGFIEHYLLPIIYPADLTRDLQLQLGVLVITINAAIYGWLLVSHIRGRNTQ